MSTESDERALRNAEFLRSRTPEEQAVALREGLRRATDPDRPYVPRPVPWTFPPDIWALIAADAPFAASPPLGEQT